MNLLNVLNKYNSSIADDVQQFEEKLYKEAIKLELEKPVEMGDRDTWFYYYGLKEGYKTCLERLENFKNEEKRSKKIIV